MRETLCASRCAGVEDFQAHCVSARRLSQNDVLGVHRSGGQEDGSRRVLHRNCRENEGEQSTPVLPNTLVRRLVCCLALSFRRRTRFIFPGRILRIRCFNFLNICTYYSEFVVVPLSKNSTYKIPSLSRKKLAMALPAEVYTLNFFVLGNERGCHSTSFHPWVVRMNAGFTTGNYY